MTAFSAMDRSAVNPQPPAQHHVLPEPTSLVRFSLENSALSHELYCLKTFLLRISSSEQRGVCSRPLGLFKMQCFACRASEFENESPGKHLHF